MTTSPGSCRPERASRSPHASDFIGAHAPDIPARRAAGRGRLQHRRASQRPLAYRPVEHLRRGMAYAEKRGKGPQPWRVKYKLPSGTQASESGFETKAAALAWGRDQEARIREGRWTDAHAEKITVSEWIERWLALQDVGVSTVDNREYLIRRFIRPAWGTSALNSLGTEEITRWENGLPARTGVSQRTARAARTLLGTILGDAAAARPPLIPYNPALRPRNRGRRTGRRLALAPQRVWATPLQVLLVAERAALLTA